MADSFEVGVTMEGGHPWGLRIDGGTDFHQPIRISKVICGSKAYGHGVEVGDIIEILNGQDAAQLTGSRARHLIRTADDRLSLKLRRIIKPGFICPETRIYNSISNATKRSAGTTKTNAVRSISDDEMSGGSTSDSQGSVISADGRKSDNKLSTSMSSSFKMSPDPTSSRGPSGSMVAPAHGTFSQSSSLERQGTGASLPPGKSFFSRIFRSGQGKQLKHNIAIETTLKEPNFLPVSSIGKEQVRIGANSTSKEPVQVVAHGRNREPEQVGASEPSKQLRPTTAINLSILDDVLKEDKNLKFSQKGKIRPVTATKPPIPSVAKSSLYPSSGATSPFPVSSVSPKTVHGASKSPSIKQKIFQLPQSFGFWDRRKNSELQMQSSGDRNVLQKRSVSPQLKTPPPTGNEIYYSTRFGRDTMQRNENATKTRAASAVPSIEWWNIDQNKARISDGNRLTTGKEHFPNSLERSTRQQWDEENKLRKQDIERILAAERQRKFLREQREMEARRHNDCCSPVEKSTILLNRFNENGLSTDNLERPLRKVATKIRGKARALYTFRAQNNKELPLKKGDTVYLLRRIDKNWFEGEHNGFVGIFPVSYVEVVQSLQEAHAIAKIKEGTATVLYDFTAQSQMELSLRKGYTVVLIRRVDENWYEGRIGNCQGIFPVSYVEPTREPDTPIATPMPSQAPTPIPGATPGRLSPASSIFSVGPDIPSAPLSPRNFDFYESDMEMESALGSLQTGRDLRSSRPSSVASEPVFQRDGSITPRPQPFTTRPNPLTARPQPLNQFNSSKDNSTQQRLSLFGGYGNSVADLSVNRNKNRGNDSGWKSDYKFVVSDLENKRKNEAKPSSVFITSSSNKQNLGSDSSQIISKAIRPTPYPRYCVLHNFKPRNTDELELKRNDVVCVVEKCKDGWYVGYMEKTKQFGTFPGNFVQQLS